MNDEISTRLTRIHRMFPDSEIHLLNYSSATVDVELASECTFLDLVFEDIWSMESHLKSAGYSDDYIENAIRNCTCKTNAIITVKNK